MTDEVHELEPDVADKLVEMQEIRKTIDTLTERYDELRDEVVVPLEETVVVVGADGEKYRVTKVEGSTPVYHEDQLHRLTDEQRERIVDTKINGTKLKAEIQAGRIDPLVATHLVHFNPKRPYPKFDKLA